MTEASVGLRGISTPALAATSSALQYSTCVQNRHPAHDVGNELPFALNARPAFIMKTLLMTLTMSCDACCNDQAAFTMNTLLVTYDELLSMLQYLTCIHNTYTAHDPDNKLLFMLQCSSCLHRRHPAYGNELLSDMSCCHDCTLLCPWSFSLQWRLGSFWALIPIQLLLMHEAI